MRRYLVLPIWLIAMVACSDDPAYKPEQEQPQQVRYKAMTSPDNVIFNLELTYNKRNIAKYEKLFDPVNFLFLFADQDINNPDLDITGPLNYDEDKTYTGNMFNPSFASTQGQLPVQNISMNLSNDNLVWEEYNDVNFPGETLQKAAVFYYFTITTATDTYYPGTDARAEFICRQADYGSGTEEWRIVRWRDLGFGGGAANAGSAADLSSTETTSWGAVKTRFK